MTIYKNITHNALCVAYCSYLSEMTFFSIFQTHVNKATETYSSLSKLSTLLSYQTNKLFLCNNTFDINHTNMQLTFSSKCE